MSTNNSSLIPPSLPPQLQTFSSSAMLSKSPQIEPLRTNLGYVSTLGMISVARAWNKWLIKPGPFVHLWHGEEEIVNHNPKDWMGEWWFPQRTLGSGIVWEENGRQAGKKWQPSTQLYKCSSAVISDEASWQLTCIILGLVSDEVWPSAMDIILKEHQHVTAVIFSC